MKNRKGATISGSFILAALLGSVLGATNTNPSVCDNGVTFRVSVPARKVYSPGASVRITVVIANSGLTELYMFRFINRCSSQLGSYHFTLLDDQGQTVRVQECYADDDMDRLDVVKALTDAKTGITLNRQETFRLEQHIKLPTKRGVYRLRAELIPAALNPEQQRALSEHQMRIVGRCLAADVVITVR
jgi:hypothetical protein